MRVLLTRWPIRVSLIVSGLIGLPAKDALAQQVAPPARVALAGPTRTEAFPRLDLGQPDSVSVPQTHWKKGAVIGGLALGIPALLIGLAWCGDPDSGSDRSAAACVIGGTAVATLTGATIGALIGGQFPKHQSLSAPIRF